MSTRDDRLFDLLPAVHRLRDAAQGHPLRALLAVMEAELRAVEENVDELYESWFVETAPEWVLPYIADLVGNRLLPEVAPSRRTDVAKTLYYRRRKGTLPMLEELARDVTGWGAHAVQFMDRLGWTQNVNHLRYTLAPNPALAHPTSVRGAATLAVRDPEALDRLAGAWDAAAHTVDVRRARGAELRGGGTPPARTEEGWYGTRNVGLFLWRLRGYPLRDVPARRADAPNSHGWHFSALGAPAPLWTVPRAERDPARLAREIHVAAPIRPLAFHADLEAYRARFLPLPVEQRPPDAEWYGPNRSLHVVADGAAVAPERILCKGLGAWARPPAGRVAVDVARGRIAFAAGEEPAEVRVSFAYGFSADLGGGPYDRRAWMADPARAGWSRTVAKGGALETLQQALAEWEGAGRPDAVITIADGEVYGGAVEIDLPVEGSLTIQAAEGRFPSVRLVGDMVVRAPEAGARLTLCGLLVEGAILLDGSPALHLAHCTLVPGRMLTDDGAPWFMDRDSVVVAGAGIQEPEVTMDGCITGAIRLPATARALTLRDVIVQAFTVGGAARPAIAASDPGDEPGPPTTLERVTVFGAVNVRELTLASETIFTAPVVAQRRQAGCVRFSYLPEGSRTPRRFHCQPDRALEGVVDPAERARVRRRMTPSFASERFGDPAYAQLRLGCAPEIRTGAENGAEMGAFASLLQPQREAALRTRLDEYLPFGLEAALIYVS